MTRDAVARLCLIAGLLHLSVSMPEAQTAAGTPPPTASNATIRARVLGASDGRPVRGATVRLEGQGAVTDESGTFELRGLSQGNHQVTVAKSGFITRRAAMEAVRGATPALQELRLVRGAVIGGFVYDTVGEPAAGVRVEVLRRQTTGGRRRLVTAHANDLTDDTGAFRIYGLPGGTYYVMAKEARSSNGFEALLAGNAPDTAAGGPIAPTYYPGAISIAEAQGIALAAGREQLGITFAVRPTPTVRVAGSVVMSDGQSPRIGSAVLRSSDTLETSAVNVWDGGFEFSGVVPGAYTLDVFVRGEQFRNEVASVPLVVADRPPARIALTASVGPSLKGEIRAERGPLPALDRLRLRFKIADDMMGHEVTVPVRANGTFASSALARALLFDIEGLPRGWTVKSFVVGGQEAFGNEVQLGDRENEVTLTLTDRGPELAGRVIARGQGVPDARVLVFPADETRWVPGSRYIGSTTTDAEGRFSVQSLPAYAQYRAVVLDFLDESDLADGELLERLATSSPTWSLQDGEKKTLDLQCCVSR